VAATGRTCQGAEVCGLLIEVTAFKAQHGFWRFVCMGILLVLV
jgi:hypothetical protein